MWKASLHDRINTLYFDECKYFFLSKFIRSQALSEILLFDIISQRGPFTFPTVFPASKLTVLLCGWSNQEVASTSREEVALEVKFYEENTLIVKAEAGGEL